MAPRDPAWLENGVFPHRCSVTTRLGDLNRYSQIDEVSIAGVLQQSRWDFLHGSGLTRPDGHQRVVAATAITFVAHLNHPGPIDVSTGVLEIGRTSIRCGQIARQNGRIGAYGEVVAVIRNVNGPVPVSPEWRANLEGLKILPGGGNSQATRVDRARLDNGVFPHRCEVTTRFADMDRAGHVNNVTIVELLQEGRSKFCHDLGMTNTALREIALASIVIDYAGDLLYPEPVSISTSVLEIGRTSFRIGQVITQKGRTGVYSEAVMVVRDATGPVPIPDDWRLKLEASNHRARA